MATPEDIVRIVYVLTARDLASAKVAEVNQRMQRDLDLLSKRYGAVDKDAGKAEKSVSKFSATTRSADRDIDRFSRMLISSSPALEQHGRKIDNVSTRLRSLGSSIRSIPSRIDIGVRTRMVGEDVLTRMRLARDELGKQIRIRFEQTGLNDILVRLRALRDQTVRIAVRETGLDAVKARLVTLRDKLLNVTIRGHGLADVQTTMASLRDKLLNVTIREHGLAEAKAKLEDLRDKTLNVNIRERGLAAIQAKLVTLHDRILNVNVRERGLAGVLARLGLIHDKTVEVNVRGRGAASVASGMRSAATEADRVAMSARRATTDVDRLGGSIARTAATAAGAGRGGGGFSKLLSAFDKFGQFGRSIPLMPLALVGGVGAIAGPVVGAVSNIIGLIGNLVAGLGALAGAWGPAFGAAAAFLPGLASLGAVMATVIVSTKGLSQVWKGNTAEFNKVAPSALHFVASIQGMRKEWTAFTKQVQQPLFAGVNNALRAIQPRRFLQTVGGGLGQTAGSLGTVAQQLGGFFGQQDTRQRITQVFAAIQPLILQLTPILKNLFTWFTNVTIAAAPLAKWLGSVAERLTQYLALSTSAGRQSGSLAAFFDKARASLTNLWTILSQFSLALFHIFQQATPLGNNLAKSLADTARNFNQWTTSLRGRMDIAGYFDTIGGSIKQTAGLLDDMVKGIFRLGNTPAVQQFVTAIRTQLGPAVSELFRSSSSLGPQLVTVIANLVKLIGALPLQAMQVFTNALDRLINGLTWMIRNIPAAKQVMTGLAVVLGGLAVVKFVGLVSGLTKVIQLMREVRTAGLGNVLRGNVPGTTGPTGAAGAAASAVAPMVAALQENTAAILANTAALTGRAVGTTVTGTNVAAREAAAAGQPARLTAQEQLARAGLTGPSAVALTAGEQQSGLIAVLRTQEEKAAALQRQQMAAIQRMQTDIAAFGGGTSLRTAGGTNPSGRTFGPGFVGSVRPALFGPNGEEILATGVSTRPPVATGLLGRLGGALGRNPAGVAGGIALGGSLLATAAPLAIPGKTGQAIGTIGGLALTGASIGSFFPGWGTAIGAAVGALGGLVISLHRGSSSANSFADAVKGAATAAQTHKAAIQAEAQARRALPGLRADVSQAAINVRAAQQQRAATEQDLVGRFAAARGVNLKTATPEQIAQLHNLARRTDEYATAQNNVTYALQAQREARRALTQDLDTISGAHNKAATSAETYRKKLQEIATTAQSQARKSVAKTQLASEIAQATASGGFAVPLPEAPLIKEANAKALQNYITQITQAGATGDASFKRVAAAAVAVAQSIGRIPSMKRVQLALDVAKGTGVSVATAAALILGKTPKQVQTLIKAIVSIENNQGLPPALAARLAAGEEVPPQVLRYYAIKQAQQQQSQDQGGKGGKTGRVANPPVTPPPVDSGTGTPFSLSGLQEQIDAAAARAAHAQAVAQAQITQLGLSSNSPQALTLQQTAYKLTASSLQQQLALTQQELTKSIAANQDPSAIQNLRNQIAQLGDQILQNTAEMVANARAIVQARFEYVAAQLDVRAQIVAAQVQALDLRAQAGPAARAPRLELRSAADIGKEIRLLREEQRQYAREARDRSLTADVRRQAQLNAAQKTVEVLQKQQERQQAIQQSFEIPAARFASQASLQDLRAQGAQLRAELASGTGQVAQGSQGIIAAQIQKEIPSLRKEQSEYAKEARDQRLSQSKRQEAALKAAEISNEILQKQLDIQQLLGAQVANALTRVGGSLSFEFNGQSFSDVISSGTGA